VGLVVRLSISGVAVRNDNHEKDEDVLIITTRVKMCEVIMFMIDGVDVWDNGEALSGDS
jgi:hypothetical protein